MPDATPDGRGVAAAGGRKSPWPLILVVAAYLLCVAAHLASSGFDITRFIVAGDRFVSASQLRYPIAVEPQSDGYDGQYFYRLALDPLDISRDAYGISMRSHPAVRAQRIVYPLAAWAVSLGQGALVPYALVAVNLLAILLLGWVAMRLAAEAGVPPGLALLIPFFPGFVLSICRDTAEIVATALALGSILAANRSRWPLAGALAGVAVLTREATLLYLAGYGLVAAWRMIRTRSFDTRVLWCLLPVGIYLGWQGCIRSIWGSFSYEVVGHDDFSLVPLLDYLRAAGGYGAAALHLPVRYSVIYSAVMAGAFGALLAFLVRQFLNGGSIPIEILVPWMAYAGMATLFSGAVWRDPWGFVRITNDFYVLGIVALVMARRTAALRQLAPAVAVAWLGSVAYVL